MAAPWEKPGPQQPFTEYSRQQPARPASVESDVVVPLLQASATGVAVAVLSIPFTIWMRWPWWLPLAIGAGTTTVVWLVLLGAHRKLLWAIETVSNAVEEIRAAPEPITVQMRYHDDTEALRQIRRFDLPEGVTLRMLHDWARAVTSGVRTPARSSWVGRGRPFSRDQYDAFCEAMEQAGILSRTGQGRQLSNGGRHSLERWAAGGGGRRGGE
jgi:hypothetical protein